MIAIPPSIRRLMSHWCLFPNRIDHAALPDGGDDRQDQALW